IVSVVAPALSGSAQRDDPLTPEQHQYWSLKKVQAVDPPAVHNRQRVRTPAEASVLAQLETQQLRHAPGAAPTARPTRATQAPVAVDDLRPAPPYARVATAFNRHYPDESNARNLIQRRQEILNDVTDTVGSVFLGLTYGCARCHDHKFDSILQEDYYRLQAFFANMRAADDV